MKPEERSFEDLLNTAEAKDWLHRAERDMFPKMQASAMSLIINSGKPDAKLALEVGAAVLFDKPLLVVVLRGQPVPPTLRRIAAEVVEIEDFTSDNGQELVREAVSRMLGRRAGGA